MNQSRQLTIALLVSVLLGCTIIGGLVWYFNAIPRERNCLLYDPIEDDPEVQPTLRASEQETDELLKEHPRQGQLGFCHIYWGPKKSILKNKYGITWRTPAELNPTVAFD
jgi:hypothetical protein